MRLIDAQSFSKDLMEEASFRTRKAYDDSSVAEARGLIRAFDLLKQQPTVDAVPVVRCAECKYYRNCIYDDGVHRTGGDCDLLGILVYGDDFCSYGERQDESK